MRIATSPSRRPPMPPSTKALARCGLDRDFVLLPYQRAWCSDKSTVRVIEKSRRIGLSWATAAETVLEAASIGGCDAWYVSYNKESSAEFIRDCAFWAKRFNVICSEIKEGHEILDGGEDKGVLTYTIKFASGFKISTLSSRPTNLRNKKGHIILDEAAFHDNLKGLLKAALAVLMWGGRARVDIISTHNGVENAFNTLVQDIRAGKLPYSLHKVTLDDAIAQGLVKRIFMLDGRNYTEDSDKVWRAECFAFYGEDAGEELLCIPAHSGGVYISRAVVERQMRDGCVYRLELADEFVTRSETSRKQHVDEWLEVVQQSIDALPKGRHHFFGMDFGRKSDRSVLCIGYLTKGLRRRFPFAIEMLGVPYEQQRQVLFSVVSRLPNFFAGAMDATGNGAYLAEVAMQQFGVSKILSVSLSEPWYALNLPPFKAAFEDEVIEVIRDADHLSDLAAFKVINGVPKLPKTKTKSIHKSVSGKHKPRHGDAAIAYALGFFAAKAPLAEYTGYKAVSPEVSKKPGFRKMRRGVM